MKRTFPAGLLIAAASVLVACGGGGGGGVSPNPGPSVTNPPTSTNAVGTLVDDPSGAPLAGVTVRLEPWTTYPTPGPSPTPVAIATTDTSGHFSIAAANGHYLLVIGSDDANDTTRPTIHDNVTLSGGVQTLVAPTMPPVPGITPPPAETSGSYRLATIDQTHEMPCITAYDTKRINAGLPKAVIDEWLTENERMVGEQSQTAFHGQSSPQNTFGALTTGNVFVSGGSQCSDAMQNLTQPPAAPYFTGSAWFGGAYFAYQQGSPYSAYGDIEFPIDPRLYRDPNVPNWP